MNYLNAIIWDVNPEIFSFDPITVRWYGLLFAMGFIIGQQILIKIFKTEGKPESDVEILTIYMVASTVLGARLGHCLFYQPDVYLDGIEGIIKIFKIWEGGLASHGAAVGILFALWLYARRKADQSYLWILDRMVITIALAAFFIRSGNLMNSEIIGKPANAASSFIFVNSASSFIEKALPKQVEDVSIASAEGDTLVNDTFYQKLSIEVSFKKGEIDENIITNNVYKILQRFKNSVYISEHIQIFDPVHSIDFDSESFGVIKATFNVYGIPRHPAQFYEALSSLLLFVILLFIYNHHQRKLPEGRIFGIFLLWIFGLRFVYEFLKENQVEFEDQLNYNMGQILSIPLVIAGVFILARSFTQKAQKNIEEGDGTDVKI